MQPTATGSLSDCRTRMLRETPSEKHWSVNWNRCWLSQANKSLSSDLATLLPKVMIQGLWALWGSSCSAVKQENRELENGPDTAIRLCPLPKAASAPSHVSTGLSAAQNYQKSPLMNFFKTASIFCLHPISLFICNLSGSHTAKGCYFGCLACLFFFSAQWIRGCPRHCVVHGFVIFLAGYSPHCKVILCSSNCWAEGVLGHHFPSEQWVGLQLQKMSLSRALPAPDGNGFPSAKYSSGHYPRWCHFCSVPIFHTPAGKQTTRQFTEQALAGRHSSVFLPPCIKFNLQNLVFPPGTSPSHSFFHAGDVPTVSQLPACQHLGSITHGGELGCAMEPDGCGGELRRKGLQRKGATAQGRSLHHRPALPCFYILPAFIHTFRLVLSISSPVNTRLCCVFLRNQLGFSIGSSV